MATPKDESKTPGKDSTAVQEEEDDWSNIMTTDGGFGRHEEFEEIQLSTGVSVKIAFASSLSPLDMMDLSWGTNDATGHCIWTGARFFLHALPDLAEYFVSRRVLELGSGTGLSGIAVAMQYATKQHFLTDSSASVLKLCKQNCELNNIAERVVVEELHWGTTMEHIERFDTVLATDVLYDIGLWMPLLQTTTASLKTGGSFILSHVPRAALPAGESCSLEEYLIKTAANEGLELVRIVRPENFVDSFRETDDMDKTDVGIFLFRRL